MKPTLEFFDLYLHHKGRQEENIFTVNIGAMDGFMFDELSGYTSMYNFKGLYVEPIPYLYEKLKNNLGSEHLFENSAISTYDGEVEMIMIQQDAIDSGKVHECFYGMSSIYPPSNGLASDGDKEVVEKYGKKVTVPCITFDTLVKKHSLTKIDVLKLDTEGHDFLIFDQVDLEKHDIDLIRLEWVNLTDEEKDSITKKFTKYNYSHCFTGSDIVGIKTSLVDTITPPKKESESYSNTTLVTGLWDIKRSELTEGWNRSFEDHYISKFISLLKLNCNLIIFGDENLKEIVFKHRKESNTLFFTRDLNWFEKDLRTKIEKIRNDKSWLDQAGWLRESTQASLEMYNPLVMSKMFLLNDAKILDRFNSEYMFWIDAGISNTVHLGYFYKDKVLSKLTDKISKFHFVAFPYEAVNEIHGFSYPQINTYAEGDVKLVCRGGFFGGHVDTIHEVNGLYYGMLHNTLDEGYMGTEESIFSILLYKYPQFFSYSKINGNGLINTFFEDIKNDKVKILSTQKTVNKIELDYKKVGLYVLTYNSPKQFEELCKSFEEYDNDYLKYPKKFLLNNSLDRNTDQEYDSLCKKYNFQQIKKDNIGICGGRQFIAEHFDEQKELQYYLFFEDDMFFYKGKENTCINGFSRKIQGLYKKSLDICNQENFSFLKLNFTEFFGDNQKQWSWHNVPAQIRKELFPSNPVKLSNDVSKAPFLNYTNIKSYRNIPYATGDIYYCNWPQIVSREGNEKMFLETKWDHPYEQTWMSHFYQLTVKGILNPGILLTTPTHHDRFDHYTKAERREN